MPELGEGREHLLVQVAQLYYELSLSQEEVARRLGISRSYVSRLLSEARRRHIVEVRVRPRFPTVPSLETELRDRFRLREAHVLLSGNQSTDMILRGLGALAAERLRDLLHAHIIVAIGWGTAVCETLNSLRPTEVDGAQIVQMIGGLATSNQSMIRIDGTELARRLAEAVRGTFRYLPAPNYVESTLAHEALMRERNVREVLALASRADVALVGIGSADPQASGFVRAGLLSSDDLQAIVQAGAVGDICGYYFDVHGRVLDLELHQRLVGLDLASIRRIKSVVAVAGRKEKARAILGALRGEYVDILVTDDTAVREVLRLSDEAASES